MATKPSCVQIACALLLVAWPATVVAQMQTSSAYTTTDDLSDVRPFQGWLRDATFTPGVDLEPVLEIGNWDDFTTVFAGAQAAFWTTRDVELGGRFGVVNFDSDNGGSESGVSDLRLYGRYRLPIDSAATYAVGSSFDLPIGDEDVFESTFDFAFFGAMRYTVPDGVAILARVGIESLERGRDNRESGIFLGGGALVPVTEELAIVAEFDLTTAVDFAAITGGVDFELPPGGHLRAAIALGLDDQAPDVELRLGFAIPVY